LLVNDRLSRLEAINAQQFWLERAVEARGVLRELQDSFPVVPSSGRAEAELRALLENAVDAAGNRRLRLSMQPAELVNDDALWRVVGVVGGVVDGETARDFIADLETKVNYARFARLRLVRGNTPDKVRVDVEMEAFFRVAGE
jgi:hypothetical protein